MLQKGLSKKDEGKDCSKLPFEAKKIKTQFDEMEVRRIFIKKFACVLYHHQNYAQQNSRDYWGTVGGVLGLFILTG